MHLVVLSHFYTAGVSQRVICSLLARSLDNPSLFPLYAPGQIFPGQRLLWTFVNDHICLSSSVFRNHEIFPFLVSDLKARKFCLPRMPWRKKRIRFNRLSVGALNVVLRGWTQHSSGSCVWEWHAAFNCAKIIATWYRFVRVWFRSKRSPRKKSPWM